MGGMQKCSGPDAVAFKSKRCGNDSDRHDAKNECGHFVPTSADKVGNHIKITIAI